MGGLNRTGIVQAPGAMTIARYMKRFGFVLSEMTIEKDFLQEHPGFEAIRRLNKALYIETIEMRAQASVEFALSAHDYRVYYALHARKDFLETTGELDLEIRHINVLRRGIKAPFRGDLALALFRLEVRNELAAEKDTEEFRQAMLTKFLTYLEQHPMDIKGAAQ